MIVDLSFDFWHETPQAELPVYISIIIIDDIAAVAGGEASKGFFLGFSAVFSLKTDGIVIPCCFLLAKLLLLNCSYGFLSGARKKLCQNGIKTIWTWSSFRVNHATANLK